MHLEIIFVLKKGKKYSIRKVRGDATINAAIFNKI